MFPWKAWWFYILLLKKMKFPKYVEMATYVSKNAAMFLRFRKQWLVQQFLLSLYLSADGQCRWACHLWNILWKIFFEKIININVWKAVRISPCLENAIQFLNRIQRERNASCSNLLCFLFFYSSCGRSWDLKYLHCHT